jgi:beta-lactamase regulating signal transducer with metallopeptidase domain
MIIAWMWQALVVGTLVAAAAFGIDGLARLAGRPLRWGWLAALALTVGLVAIAPLRTGRGSPPTTAQALVLPVSTSQGLAQTPSASRWALSSLLAIPRAFLSHAGSLRDRPVGWVERHAPGLGRWMILLWAALTLGLFALLCTVEWRFRRARAAWPLAELHGVRVRVAPEAGPAVIGVRHPEIVVPRWLLARDTAAQRLVVAHEREHVESGDPMLLAAGWAAVVLLPWHPAVWWMAARLRLAVEMDCDMRLLRQGVVPRLYGTLLIDLAAECSGLGAGAPAFSDRPTQLERRLSAMMPTKPMVRRFARARGALGAVLAIGSIAMACEARVPTTADVQQMDASSAVYAARQVGIIGPSDKNVHYSVNGNAVSVDSARAVKADSVAEIEVLKCHTDSVTVRYVPGTPPSDVAKGCSEGASVAVTTKGYEAAFTRRDYLKLRLDSTQVRQGETVGPTSDLRYAKVRLDSAQLRLDTSGVAAPAATELLHGTVAGLPVTRMNVIPTHAQAAASWDSSEAKGKQPVFLLDGVRISAKRARALLFDSTGSVGIPNGSDIESIEVIKGAAAMKLFSDPDAVNGVISIKTKH